MHSWLMLFPLQLFSAGRLADGGDGAFYSSVVCRLDSQIGVMYGFAVKREEGVKEGVEHTALWCSDAESYGFGGQNPCAQV